MAYYDNYKTTDLPTWENDVTQLNAENINRIRQAVQNIQAVLKENNYQGLIRDFQSVQRAINDFGKNIQVIDALPNISNANSDALYITKQVNSPGQLYCLTYGFPFELNKEITISETDDSLYYYKYINEHVNSGTLVFQVTEGSGYLDTWTWNYASQTLTGATYGGNITNVPFEGSLYNEIFLRVIGLASGKIKIISNTLFTLSSPKADVLLYFWKNLSEYEENMSSGGSYTKAETDARIASAIAAIPTKTVTVTYTDGTTASFDMLVGGPNS